MQVMLWPRRAKFTPGTVAQQTRTNYEIRTRKSTGRWQGKSIRDVTNPDRLALQQDADDVETVGLRGPPMAIDPRHRRAGELALLSPTYRFNWAAEVGALSSFDFDERNESVTLDDQVYVSVARPKPAMNDLPPTQPQPSLSDPLAHRSQRLPCLRHGANVGKLPESPSPLYLRPNHLCGGSPPTGQIYSPTMIDEQELVVLVDEHDREMGTSPKLEAHRIGQLHRAVSVFLFNPGGRLLLQQRAARKYHSAGLWANTCCSHPRPGESPINAAQRRLREEMGIECALAPAGAFTYRADVGNSLVEHEFDHLFTACYSGEPRPNPNEVARFRWLLPVELELEIRANPAAFAPWLSPALAKVTAASPTNAGTRS